MIVSAEAKQVLRLLRARHNVLIAGAPGTGKTRLANEVKEAFTLTPPLPYNKTGKVPFPKHDDIPDDIAEWLPSPDRRNRKYFTTVFHQGTKHRDFVCGIVPVPGGSTLTFRVHKGILLEAAEFAMAKDCAALVVVEEINRGPAVAAFGGAIVAFEGDKRLAPDGESLSSTTRFDVLQEDGTTIQMALPAHLYLVATMNQADTSVEALDVAFLRRWAQYRIAPDANVLAEFFGIDLSSPAPQAPTDASDVYRAAVDAWLSINRRINIGRGAEFEIGHGVLMQGGSPAGLDSISAAAYLLQAWEGIRAHVEEVFFGDVLSIAEVLNVGPQTPSHPYKLVEHDFAGGARSQLLIENATAANLFGILRAVAGGAAET